MNQKETIINLIGNTGENVIRYGQAAEILKPQKVELHGTITAPADFVANRNPDPHSCHAIFSKEDYSISLVCDEKSPISTEITGKLTLNKFLKSLRINDSKQPYQRAELADAFKFARRFFVDKVAHKDLIRSLNTFDDKVFLEHNQTKDGKVGVKNVEQKSRVELGLQNQEILLSIPIFEGADYEVVRLAFEIEARNGIVLFWLVSDELPETIEGLADVVFMDERKRLQDAGIYCIDEF